MGSWSAAELARSGRPEGVLQELQAEAHRAAAAFANVTLRPLAYWIASKVRESAQLRADEGRLDFHDLLVLARRVLRSNADVRAPLHKHVWPCPHVSGTDPAASL